MHMSIWIPKSPHVHSCDSDRDKMYLSESPSWYDLLLSEFPPISTSVRLG